MRTLVDKYKLDTFTLDDTDEANKVYIVDDDTLIKRVCVTPTICAWLPVVLHTGSDCSYSFIHGLTAAECIANLLVYFAAHYRKRPKVIEYTPGEYQQWLSERWSKII